ncbi:hypothetical protein [Microbacterium flavescens]|uniref:hypothetical protein n=1 Tax=Microbacterium flavescens TaxID=69366 RepID=UPI001BDE21EE|nr:hypothetical protein [Microbacterium flavescens]BFF10429.1 hypothetical protein GCM10025699_17320 [Microbacterium flavescens]
MPTELLLVAAIVVGVVGIGVASYLLRRRTRANTAAMSSSVAQWPVAGVVVPQDVFDAGSSPSAILAALQQTATPLALEYYPVSQAELTRYRMVPVNSTVQQSLVEIVKAIHPKDPTLFKVILPAGEKLVQAVGSPGMFRGWAHNGAHISSQALLKPVAAGGALAAGWPLFAVAGTVMVVDMIAQREHRAFQRKVETILGRQELRAYQERIASQRGLDGQLTRAISLLLDGKKPNLEIATARAYDEFHTSQQFLHENRDVIDQLLGDDGKVDFRRLEAALGGKTRDVDYFIGELYLARVANALYRRALLADAASSALDDPSNPYAAFRRDLESKAEQLEKADKIETSLTDRLSQIELKGRWWGVAQDRWIKSDKSVEARQRRLRAKALPASSSDEHVGEGAPELRYIALPSGEIQQLLLVEEGALPEAESSSESG